MINYLTFIISYRTSRWGFLYDTTMQNYCVEKVEHIRGLFSINKPTQPRWKTKLKQMELLIKLWEEYEYVQNWAHMQKILTLLWFGIILKANSCQNIALLQNLTLWDKVSLTNIKSHSQFYTKGPKKTSLLSSNYSIEICKGISYKVIHKLLKNTNFYRSKL